MKKNDFFLALMLTIAALMTGQTAWADWTGDGSSDNPYQIDTYEKLKEFAAMVNGTGVYNESANPDACAILTGDIVCKNSFDDEDYATDWTPIGNATNKYTGTFDGRDQDGKVHTIIGLSTSTDNTSDYVGLFGYVGSSGKVQNVKLEDANITGKSYVGGIVGNSAGIVQYCALIGTSNIRSSGGNSGGIAGFNSGTVKNSYVAISGSCSISSTNSNAGGIVGYNNATIENCHYSGSGAISANVYIGGIVGYNANYGRVHNCYYAGTGTIGGSNANYVGAVIGYNHNNATPQYCYYNKNNTTLTRAIGNANDTENVKGLTTDQFKFISNFSGFTVENWSQGEIAPLLKGMPYTISFNANGGEGSMANQTVTLGDNDLLRVNAFTRTNYHFMGWNTKADGTGVAVATNAQACLVGPETLYAQWALASGTCGKTSNDNVTWAVTDEDHNGTYETLTISGTGAMANYNNNKQPWKDFKSVITTVVIGDGVTIIGNDAFNGCTALTAIDIPASVESIGEDAFANCENLATVSGGDGLTSIGANVFYGTAWKNNLANNLPDGLTYVGHVAFLMKGDAAGITFAEGTTQIYDDAFYQCTTLTTIIIPASVESIGEDAFAICEKLGRVYVLRTTPITTLGFGAFNGCDPYLVIVVPADADYINNSLNGYWQNYNLQSGYTVTCDTGITFTTTNNGPLVETGETVTLSASREGYSFVSYSVKDKDGDPIGMKTDNTFLMNGNAFVTATWTKLLSNTDIAVGAIADQPYTGSDITPEVTVWDGTTDISGECEFAYSNNQNTGTATVTITAKETSTGYSGSTTITFNIVPKNVGDYGAVQILEDQYGKHGIIDGNYLGDVVVNLEEDIEVKDVTFIRTFPTDGYSTLVLPFEISTSKLTGVNSVLSFEYMTNDENGMLECAMSIVWKNSDEPVELQAYTPYIVLMNNSHLGINTTSPTSPVMFKRTEDAFTERGDWEFRGTTAYTVWDATHNNTDLGKVYGFAATAVTEDKIEIGDFVRAEAGAFIRPLRAFLYYRGSDTNWNHSQSLRRAPAIDELPDRIPVRIVDDEDADRISLTPALSKGEGDWYTIDGRKLGGKPTQRGLYINGGKKVVVK